jgi:phenylacetate-CoA ligase
MGPVFLEQVPRFIRRERFGPEEWYCYQTARLRRLLRWCFDRVPHYRWAWSRAGLTSEELAHFTLDQLQLLPLTEKEHIRRDPEAFLASGTPRRQMRTSVTNDSTRTPLAVRMTTETVQTWYAAYEARCRRWAGVDHTMSRAMIGGQRVVPQAAARQPFWRYNLAERQLYLSAFHIAPAHVEDYVRALNRYRPEYLVGDASAHFLLARLIEEAGRTVHSPRAVLLSSESLTVTMRATLSRVYRCPVYDAYIGVEPCCLASECEHHRLHVSPDVGTVELLDRQGRPVRSGEAGEIVATGFINLDQPLVRYRMGDLAAWSDECCACGRAMPILKEVEFR